MCKNVLVALSIVAILSMVVLNCSIAPISATISGAGALLADASASGEWFYGGWQYRKEHRITITPHYGFYDMSPERTTIQSDPVFRHAFQPVHRSAIVEVNVPVDGAVRKYLSYDSDPDGYEIRLYYTNDTDGSWTEFSGNPILGPLTYHYRWPSVALVDGVFHMFLTDRTDGTLERWTSTDGIHFTFRENIKSGGNPWKNPFVWLNPNDDIWYLYTHDNLGSAECFKVRNATNIEDLDTRGDTVVVSRAMPFGSPSVTYYDGKYWLTGEVFQGGPWKVVAYYSATSPSSGFRECFNSPILSDDEACPMIMLHPSQARAYLFTDRDSSQWYQETREVYINKSIVLDESLTDYQVRVIANYGSGTDSGENLYLNSHARLDFGDVRFSWLDSTSGNAVECRYWIEEMYSGQNATFWIKVPMISSLADTRIYVYYGNDTATTTSNGQETFEFFDDFSGTLSKWTVVGGTWQIENGELSAQTNSFGQRIRAKGLSFGNNSVHMNIKWVSGTYFEHGAFLRGQQPNEPSNGYMAYASTWDGDYRHRISRMLNNQETTVAGQGFTSPSKNVWYDYFFAASGNVLKSSMRDTYSAETSGVDNSFTNGSLCLFSWSASAEHVHYDNIFVCKFASPEPSRAGWGSEETAIRLLIDQSSASDNRADVGSVQTVGFHAKWNVNSSDVVGGTIYVNNTEWPTNGTGWADFQVGSSAKGKDTWTVTGVNCSGVTAYSYDAQDPSIIWDRVEIVNGGVTVDSTMLGMVVTVWFQAKYEYDGGAFSAANGVLFVNGQMMTWSTANSRWEYDYLADVLGSRTFAVTEVRDSSYGLKTFRDVAGPRTVNVWSSVISVVSNSTISGFFFNSTDKMLSFTASGLTGTTGYTNITIAKTLSENLDGLAVYLDGNPIAYTTTATNYSWTLTLTYTHSTHHIVISLNTLEHASIIQSVSSLFARLSEIAMVTAGSVMLIFAARRRKKKLSL